MKNLILLLSFLVLGNQAWSVDFTTLTQTESVAVVIEVQQKSYVDIMLDIDLDKINRESLALKVKCTINGNVFYEYKVFEKGNNGSIKRILLEPGKMFKAELFLHEKGMKSLIPVSGTFDLVRQRSIQVSESVSASTFLSDLWAETQLPLFRFIKEDGIKKTLNVKFNFTDQYEYDKLHYKVKVISPVDGILLYEEVIEVNTEKYVARKPKSIEIDLTKIPVVGAGTYYLQFQHNMNSSYLNGVKSLEYELNEN